MESGIESGIWNRVTIFTFCSYSERIAAGCLLLGEVLLSRNYFYAMEVFSLIDNHSLNIGEVVMVKCECAFKEFWKTFLSPPPHKLLATPGRRGHVAQGSFF